MKRAMQVSVVVVAVLLLLGLAVQSWAQESKPALYEPVPTHPVAKAPSPQNSPGRLFVPPSSLVQKVPSGHYFAAHTNVEVYAPNGVTPGELPPFLGYGYQTPASLGCHYGLFATGAAPICDPYTTNASPTGGSQTIAIVDAYDNPEAVADLAVFSLQFGIPFNLSQFQVVWANPAGSSCPGYLGFGVPIDETGGWEVEESLDVQWAHAMAPGAHIYLVEACSNFDSDLQLAVLVANNLVQCGATEINGGTGALGTCPAGSTGKGEVSMSFGGGEYAAETGIDGCANLDDSCFTAANVVYVASSGDSPGVIYPSTSPNVVAAGGTTVHGIGVLANTAELVFTSNPESAWVFGGGGTSSFEAKPSYQTSLSHNATSQRGTPDLSFDADPYSGVYVYDTFPIDGFFYYENGGGEAGWITVGGTSVSAPSLAGIINNAATISGNFSASSNAELTLIYGNRLVPADITPIENGFCGPYMAYPTFSAGGWNFCTGVGVVNGYSGK
jgi:kumamolisin